MSAPLPTPPLPVLLGYQRDWVLDRSDVKVCIKSRRIGITWATAYEAVEVASDPNGSDFWYQAGASGDDAKEFIRDVADWAQVVGVAANVEHETLEGDEAHEWFLLPEGERSVQVTSVRFRSGFRVGALPAPPRKLRGKEGVWCLDEAAYHDDLDAAMEAASAFTLWERGRLILISTMGDADDPWSRLVDAIRGGDPNAVESTYSLHEITLLDARADGLYRRICEKSGKQWSAEREQQWLDKLLAMPGAETEFLCIPRRSGLQYIPRALVEPCQREGFAVRTFDVEPGFVHKPEAERNATIDGWLQRELAGPLERLPRDRPHFVGEDFGRSSDRTCIAVGNRSKGDVLEVPLLVELGNMPYDSQRRVLFHILDRLPRFSKGVFDATGNGGALAEAAVQRWGVDTIEAVHMTDKWYAEHVPQLRARFESLRMAIPRSHDVVQALGRFQTKEGKPFMPKQRTTTKAANDSGRRMTRHGDAAIALACLTAAAASPAIAYRYEPTGRSSGERYIEGLF